MLADRYGLPISTSSAAARDAYVAGCDGVLSAAPGDAAHLARAIEADPGLALAHVALARARFLMADVAGARASAARARELGAAATPREQSHIDALALSIEGKPVESFAATRAHLAEHPRDAMVAAPATGVFGLIGFSGRQGAWRVTISGSRAADNWDLRVERPNGFERSYSLSGSAGEHEPAAICAIILKLVPPV